MRKRIVFLAVCCLLFIGNIQVFAAEAREPMEVTVSPLMDYIAQASASIYIDYDGVATVNSSEAI